MIMFKIINCRQINFKFILKTANEVNSQISLLLEYEQLP